MSAIPMAVVFPCLMLLVIVFLLLWANVFQYAIDVLITHQEKVYDRPTSRIGMYLWAKSSIWKAGNDVLEEF